ncbi:MAG: AAA family ATPase, partial [Candidatus Riflebacteria bacterium]|nr:AAA family ATPase [Candidatus Riflebacteria bacterium]
MGKEQYLTSSLYTFENMREGNFLYVDKTQYLWKMINQPLSMFFFSRPRRFGKSLTLSTLKAIFQGKKELFKDLYMGKQSYDWTAYPVIHIDMGSNASSTPEELKEELISTLKFIATEQKIELTETLYNKKFEELVKKLHDRDGKVVILIDEYDKPILNNIENENINDLQKIMKGFYSVLK